MKAVLNVLNVTYWVKPQCMVAIKQIIKLLYVTHKTEQQSSKSK